MGTCLWAIFNSTKLHGKFGNKFMSSEFWSDKKVLVTGATGFIGSWLTEDLVSKGSKVSVFVKKIDPLGIDAINHLKDKINFLNGDITQPDTINKAIEDQEIILHLAASSQVLRSIENPYESFLVNTIGTANLLEEIRKINSNPIFIFASTDKVYGEPKYLPIDENHMLDAKSPYDASKLAADRLAYSYFKTYGMNISISRWSNTIGGRDPNHLRALPDFITSLLNNKPITIRRTGEDVRDYMYVTDAIEGIEILAEKINLTKGEAFNFGTERPTKLIELANLVLKIMGLENKIKPVILGKIIPGEIDKQYLSAKKVRDLLNWKPKISLEDGVRKTIEWYSQNRWWEEIMNRVKNAS